jgi:hypothetical protein
MRQSDSLWNGAVIGAGALIASGLSMCRLMEPWDVCLEAGPIIRIGAVGAGIGAGVDALIRGRKTIYAPTPRATLHLAPVVDTRTRGIAATISF